MELERILAGAWRFDSPWHGDEHWRCVAATGLALTEGVAGADRLVVVAFGLIHDTRRENETYDRDHGPRAAAYARELHTAGLLALGAEQLDLLAHACELHSFGQVTDDPTVGACWDADRLHLPRVGIEPDPELFSTRAAHGEGPLAAAAALRADPPPWSTLLP